MTMVDDYEDYKLQGWQDWLWALLAVGGLFGLIACEWVAGLIPFVIGAIGLVVRGHSSGDTSL
jgi:hypothetical protein